MNRLVLAIGLVGVSGCVTTAAITRPNRVPLPILFGAAAADFLVISLIAANGPDYSVGGALAAGGAVTATDLVVGCILGACSALKP